MSSLPTPHFLNHREHIGKIKKWESGEMVTFKLDILAKKQSHA